MIPTIEINEKSRTPKYIQLAESISRKIKNKSLSNDEQLPSINLLSALYDLSRDTVRKAYLELKKKDLVEGVRGKGYYIKFPQVQRKRIFFLMNKLSSHKKQLYDAFMRTLGPEVKIDFFIYNNHFDLFKQLLLNNQDDYSHYVIIPHFYSHGDRAVELINRLPKEKLILLDKKLDKIEGVYACVYQDFEKNIYDSMTEAKELLRKYQTLKLVFPLNTYQPREIINGFQKYCFENFCNGKLVANLDKEEVKEGEAYITMMEDDLVSLIKKIKKTDLKVGKHIGILSYNENPLKEILLDGITVMSTDFEQLGRTAAEFILNEEKEHRSNPFRLIIRNSL